MWVPRAACDTWVMVHLPPPPRSYDPVPRPAAAEVRPAEKVERDAARDRIVERALKDFKGNEDRLRRQERAERDTALRSESRRRARQTRQR